MQKRGKEENELHYKEVNTWGPRTLSEMCYRQPDGVLKTCLRRFLFRFSGTCVTKWHQTQCLFFFPKNNYIYHSDSYTYGSKKKIIIIMAWHTLRFNSSCLFLVYFVACVAPLTLTYVTIPSLYSWLAKQNPVRKKKQKTKTKFFAANANVCDFLNLLRHTKAPTAFICVVLFLLLFCVIKCHTCI